MKGLLVEDVFVLGQTGDLAPQEPEPLGWLSVAVRG